MKRPIPYKGEERYIFVSYAHKDSELVWPIIQQMIDAGYRVWYDDGIDPGSEWDENIAMHVNDCGYFVAFLSENYLASNNCKDELNFSRDQGKPQLLIYLEDVELPKGMAMRLGRNQAIFYHRYADKSSFFEKFYEAQGLAGFGTSGKTGKKPEVVSVTENADAAKLVVKETVPSPGGKTKGNKKWLPAAILLAVILAAVVWMFAGKSPSTSEGNNEKEQLNENLSLQTNVVLLDNEQIKVTAMETFLDSRYFTLKLTIDNKAGKELYLKPDAFYLNGVACDSSYAGTIGAKSTSAIEMYWNLEEMKKVGIDPEKVTLIEFDMDGWYTDNSQELELYRIVYYPYGEKNATIVSYVPTETDLIVADTEDFFAAVTGNYYDEEEGRWVLKMVCVNHAEEILCFETDKECINNYMIHSSLGERIHAGRTMHCEIDYGLNDIRYTGNEKVLHYSAQMDIYNSESYPEGQNVYTFDYDPMGENTVQEPVLRQVAPEELLMENEYVRVAYLGAEYSGDRIVDRIYICNLTEEAQEIDMELIYDDLGDQSEYDYLNMDAGRERICSFYRPMGNETENMTARIRVGIWAIERGEFLGHFAYDEEVSFDIVGQDEI